MGGWLTGGWLAFEENSAGPTPTLSFALFMAKFNDNHEIIEITSHTRPATGGGGGMGGFRIMNRVGGWV